MNLTADIDLGQSLRLRTLTTQDVDLVVEATGSETLRCGAPAGRPWRLPARRAGRWWHGRVP